MARIVSLMCAVLIGLAFLSRSCSFTRPGGPVALMHGRIVSATGDEDTTKFVAIADGKIAAVSRLTGLTVDSKGPLPFGAQEIDISGLYVAATTFDKTAPTLIDGIRHVWIGQLNVGDPGDVVIMRGNPARLRPGYIPESDAIVGAVVDGRYYTGTEIRRRR